MNPQSSSSESDGKSLTINSLVIARAWRDPAYRANLKANPESVLVEEGLSFPAGTNFTVLENTPTVRYVTLTRNFDPQKGAAQLEQVLSKLLPIAPGTEVRLVQSSETERYIVLPVVPASVTLTTSEKQLHQLALTEGVTSTSSVQTTVSVSTALTTVEVATFVVVAAAIVIT